VAIIAYNYPGLALLRLINYFKQSQVKIIADCTEWYQPKGGMIYTTLKKIDTFLRMQVAHKKVYSLIVISSYLQNYYKSYKLKVVKIPPLVDLKMSKWQNLYKRSSNSEIKLIYCGSPGSGGKDRLDQIVQIVNKLVREQNLNLKLTVVGLTRNQFISSFNSNISPIKNIFFKGKIAHVKALKLIANSDYQIFLRDNILTNNAGFPTKFAESISCGTPVITNETSNINEYLTNYENGYLLKQDNIEGYVSNLKKIFIDTEKIGTMKANCKSSKLFHYKNYITMFKSILIN
jgi:glycosyltransferase involved in cell wall biosynthesis